MRTNVYAGGGVIAEQHLYDGGEQEIVWKQRNPVAGTEVEHHQTYGGTYRKEYDPFGLELGDGDPYMDNVVPDYTTLSGGSFYRDGGNPFDGSSGCIVNFVVTPCSEAMRRCSIAGIAFVFTFPPIFPHPSYPPQARIGAGWIGTSIGHKTLINTLTLKPDCKTVTNSFPGLPF